MEGIFTSDQEQKISQLLDEAVKLKGFAELIDGHLFKGIISFVDNTYVDRLADELKAKLSDLATACLEEDVDEAERLASEVLNGLIDIPGLDEDSEALIFHGVVEIIVAAVQKWVEKRKEEETEGE